MRMRKRPDIRLKCYDSLLAWADAMIDLIRELPDEYQDQIVKDPRYLRTLDRFTEDTTAALQDSLDWQAEKTAKRLAGS